MGGTALISYDGGLTPCAVVTGSTMETATVGVSQYDGTLVYAPQSFVEQERRYRREYD
jgi:hypothetical protein